MPEREPRLVERGTEEAAEDGLGVGVSIGSHTRVRPLLRKEADNPFVIARSAATWQSQVICMDCHTSLRTGSQ